MNIIKVNGHPQLERAHKEDNFLTSIFDKVFLICKKDPTFSQKKIVVEQVDSQLAEIQAKLIKQDSLLSKSTDLKKDMSRKVNILKQEILDLRTSLLETLGSEL